MGDQRTDGLDSQLLVLEIVRYFQETVWEVSLANLDIEIYAGMCQGIQGGGFIILSSRRIWVFLSFPFARVLAHARCLYYVTYLTDSLFCFTQIAGSKAG